MERTMPELATIDTFKSNIRGDVVEQEENGYDEARRVYNNMIDKKPRLIVYCKNTTDVITAVNFARENDLLTAVRGGGHNAAGLGLCDGGIVIDLSKINFVHVDPNSKTATVGG